MLKHELYIGFKYSAGPCQTHLLFDKEYSICGFYGLFFNHKLFQTLYLMTPDPLRHLCKKALICSVPN